MGGFSHTHTHMCFCNVTSLNHLFASPVLDVNRWFYMHQTIQIYIHNGIFIYMYMQLCERVTASVTHTKFSTTALWRVTLIQHHPHTHGWPPLLYSQHSSPCMKHLFEKFHTLHRKTGITRTGVKSPAISPTHPIVLRLTQTTLFNCRVFFFSPFFHPCKFIKSDDNFATF